MNYTEIKNLVDEDNRVINWRLKFRRVQIRCPKCDRFFNVPKDVTFDDNGYASTSIYHFCDDIYPGEENNDGWVVVPHLIGWGL